MKNKSQLRQQMRSITAAASHSEIATASALICRHLASADELLEHVKTIAVYAAHGNELDLTALHQLLPNRKFLYPLCHKAGRLTYHHVQDPETLTPGMMGILEPYFSQHPEQAVEGIDLFLCPGLAFTREGLRLGQGGGFYDRILSQKNKTTRVVGICLERQVLDNLPCEPHDMNMDYLLTERGLQKPY